MKNILLLLIGVLLFFTLIIFKLDLSTLISEVSEKISWQFYTIISLLVVFQLLFRSLRFKLLFNRSFNNRISLLNSFLLTSASFFIALATPNKIGDVSRGLFFKNKKLEATAISLIEYLFDTLVILIIPVFGLFIMYKSYFAEIAVSYIFLALIVIIAFLIFKFFRFDNFINNFSWYRKNKDKLKLLKTYFKEGLKNKLVLLIGFLFTCMFLGIYFFIFYAVLHKIGAHISMFQTIVSAGIGVFVGSLTFIPMGMGTRDVSSYSILVSLGVNPDIALSSVIIMRSLSLPLILVSGCCYFIAIHKFQRDK